MLGVDASEKNEEGRDLHAIASHLKQWASVDAIEHYKKLADVDAETAQPDAAVLCNPKLWRQADVFLQALEKRGEYLTLEQLTEKDNTQRAPLHYAHMCGKLPALLRHVFAHEAPSLDLFVDSKRQLTEMGAFVLRAQSCELACEALRGAGPDAIRALYKALPEEGRAQVSQYHALLAQAEQAFLDTTVRR